MIFLVDGRGPALVRVRYDDDREPIMRDGPVLSCAGPAQEPASVGGAVTECLPPAFADCLLDSALEPVLDAAVRRGRQAAKRRKSAGVAAEVTKALLAVTVCDPACGSGDLLVAAAYRIARRVAQAREGNQSPDALRRALRDVAGNCVYGVDVSAEAVERTRDRLRRAAGVPGRPPPFLDARVRPGNALIGARPDQIEGGIPDEAFRAADGDDRGYARSLRRANARPVPGQATLFSVRGGYSHSNEALAKSLAKIAGAPGEAAAGDRRQAAEYQQWRDSADFRAKRLVADAWCAAFAWAKTPDAPPALVSRTLLDLREQGAEGVLPAQSLAEIGRLRDEHQFFHWHLEFPDVFRVAEGETHWRGGFSCVLSAPPQEKVDRHGDSTVFRFAAGSGAYPECAAGLAEPGGSALRTDQLFTERVLAILAPDGRAGCAVAAGTAAAPGARYLLGALMRRGALASLYDFTGPAARLCLLTLAGTGLDGAGPDGTGPDGAGLADTGLDGTPPGGTTQDLPTRGSTARFAFRLDDPAELADGGRSFTLTPDEAALINPNTGGLPAFRGSRDAALVTAVYRRVPALWNETRRDGTRAGGNPWKMRLETAFPRAAAEPGLLRTERELREEGWEPAGSAFTRDGQRMLPLYEPAMVDVYDHRVAEPRYWIAARGPVTVQRKGEAAERPGVAGRLAELGWNWEWLCAWRVPLVDRPVVDRPVVDRPVVDRPVVDRTVHERPVPDRAVVALFLPRAATAASLPLMLPRVVPPFAAALIAAQSSLVFDYVARQKTDGPALRAAHWKQLPVPAPDTLEPHLPFIVPRLLELVYTSPDLRPLARDLDDPGDPFAWDPERRAALRAELDAFFFRAYGIDDRADVEYIITSAHRQGAGDSEQGKGQNDDGGRARELILAAYDRLAEADTAGAEYETRIYPPPGHGPRSEPKPLLMAAHGGTDGVVAMAEAQAGRQPSVNFDGCGDAPRRSGPWSGYCVRSGHCVGKWSL
jgi:hypothetical protein